MSRNGYDYLWRYAMDLLPKLQREVAKCTCLNGMTHCRCLFLKMRIPLRFLATGCCHFTDTATGSSYPNQRHCGLVIGLSCEQRASASPAAPWCTGTSVPSQYTREAVHGATSSYQWQRSNFLVVSSGQASNGNEVAVSRCHGPILVGRHPTCLGVGRVRNECLCT